MARAMRGGATGGTGRIFAATGKETPWGPDLPPAPVPTVAETDALPLWQQLEVLLFIAEEPVGLLQLREQLLPQGPGDAPEPPGYSLAEVEAALETLRLRLADPGYCWQLVAIAGGYQLITKSQFAPLIKQAQLAKDRRRLSRAALEVLAIVAYRQPVTRAEVEHVRGVASDYAIGRLLEKKLIEPAGRADLPGKPLLYQTTTEFLAYFGLNAPTDLPAPSELDPAPETPEAAYSTPIPDGQTPEA